MGLDMYMYATKKGQEPSGDDEVAYWRKANQIHAWFEREVAGGDLEDCGYLPVPREKVEELIETCKKVMEDHELAEELLPTEEGYFFGSQEYDKWYFENISMTIEKLERVLDGLEEDEELYYMAWW